MKACWISCWVFITKGPRRATGSPIGRACSIRISAGWSPFTNEIGVPGRTRATRGAATSVPPTFAADLVVAAPETTKVRLEAADEFVILACDGVWSVMSSQEACSFVKAHLQHGGASSAGAAPGCTEAPPGGHCAALDEAARALAEEAIRRECCDNTTVVLVCLVLGTAS